MMIRIFTSSVVDTSVVGWLQSVHNTFLRCLRDVSKSVCYIALVPRTCEM